MTTLIVSGTLFSGWRNILKKHVSIDSSKVSAHAEITALNEEICGQQFPEPDKLGWRPFAPENKYINKASQLFSSVETEPLFMWDDSDSCLYLNFWKTATEDAKFVMFYSSPEFELSNYLNSHPFNASCVENIIDAWVIRTRAMLNFFMNNRDRCLLVDVQRVNSDSGSFIKVLKKNFDIEFEPTPSKVSQQFEKSILVEYLATTLLLQNSPVSELYDEVRSAATLLAESDKSISSIRERNYSLVSAFLNEVSALKELGEAYSDLEDELSLNQLQLEKMEEELDNHLQKGTEKKNIINAIVNYLSHVPLLKFARKPRKK